LNKKRYNPAKSLGKLPYPSLVNASISNVLVVKGQKSVKNIEEIAKQHKLKKQKVQQEQAVSAFGPTAGVRIDEEKKI